MGRAADSGSCTIYFMTKASNRPESTYIAELLELLAEPNILRRLLEMQ